MHIASYHGRISDQFEFSDFVRTLSKACGLTPLLDEAREHLERHLASGQERVSRLGVTLPPVPVALADQQREILVSDAGDSAILIRVCAFALAGMREAYVDLLAASAHALPDVPGVVREAVGLFVQPGSSISATKVRALERRLGAPSPHGRLLADAGLRAGFRRLYDDQLRRDIAAVLGAVGENPVPIQYLTHLDTFKGRPESVHRLMADDSVAGKQFLVHCDACEISHLAFADRDKARGAVRDAGARCGACGERRLEVYESYSIHEQFSTGIRQGLWLESLASDVVAERGGAVWTGRMVDANEVDVLALHVESTLLFECREAPFGQKDLYVAAMKAQDVGADEVVILSTRGVHHNVREAVERLNAGARAERRYSIISQETCESIRWELGSVLERIEADHLRGWLEGDRWLPSWGLRTLPTGW